MEVEFCQMSFMHKRTFRKLGIEPIPELLCYFKSQFNVVS